MSKSTKISLATEIAGIKMKNPIMPASGCFGFGRDYAKFYDLSLLGGIAIKAVSLEPRHGNDTPRVAETAAGMLNSIGLQNPGLDKVIESELKFLEQYDTRIFVNVVGNTVEDYCAVVERISRVERHPAKQSFASDVEVKEVGTMHRMCPVSSNEKSLQRYIVDAIELNVSCPNVKNGIHFGTNENELEALTREVKRVSSVPVFVKLSPNVTNIVAMAKAAQRGGADGLSLINTLLGMRIDLKTRKPILARGSGGLSGPAIKPVAIRMVYETSNEVKLPIIGMGGVSEVDDVIEFMIAGASAVAVGTSNFVEPMICPELIAALPARLEELGISSLKELRK